MVGQYDRYDIVFTMIKENGAYPRAGENWFYSTGERVPGGPPTYNKLGVILGSLEFIFPEMEEHYYELGGSAEVECVMSITATYPDKCKDVSDIEDDEAMEILEEIARIGEEDYGYSFSWDSEVLYDFPCPNSVQIFFE